ncbi:hypothetical protein C6P40_002746 [Pichia californica]|uniref:Uncharacterized protein n=1 Tax=Pichia californica TaxID=460514 RepID=A0A9P6WHD0_9ASCO|nr:hypothetical protein C6P42_002664 [[Candida] californica]KAG0687195.1 hypothetical protein C6P40_002746 [[Candida] californica]
MKTTLSSKYIQPALSNIEMKKPILNIPFKYNHVIRFRHKADSRTHIINSLLPNEFKLSTKFLFKSIYFHNDLKFIYKDLKLIKINQNKILEIGSNLLILRLYLNLLKNRSELNSIKLLDSINPFEFNTLKIRHDFINQFNQILDSKNLLSKIKINSKIINTIKIEKSTRHKVLPMLIGLIHCQYGSEKSKKFIDEWVY